jgi:hypothetical protein
MRSDISDCRARLQSRRGLRKVHKGIKMFHAIDINEPTVMMFTPTCGWCKKEGAVEVPTAGFLARQLHAPIQDCFPELDKALREQIISGTHPKCWTEMFGEAH